MGEHLMALSRLGVRQRMRFAERLALEPWASDLDLRPPAFGSLRTIAARGHISQVEVAVALGLHASDMVKLIDALEGHGWVSRLRSRTDRRRYELTLTAEGWQVLRRMEKIAAEVEDAFVSSLSTGEREVLDGLLGRLLEEHFAILPGEATRTTSP